MAIGVFSNWKIYIDGYDRSGYVNTINLGQKNDLQDSTSVGDTTRIFASGLNDTEFTCEGFYDPEYTDFLYDELGTDDTIISCYPSAAAANTVGYGLPGTLSEYSPNLKVGELRAFRISAKSTDKAVRITALDGEVTKSSTGNGTARHLGAVSASQRVYSFIHVLAASGSSPTLDVTIRSDEAEGFTTPITRITHTQFSDVGAEMKSASGAITDDWWRATYTLGGSTPSFDVIVGVGIV